MADQCLDLLLFNGKKTSVFCSSSFLCFGSSPIVQRLVVLIFYIVSTKVFDLYFLQIYKMLFVVALAFRFGEQIWLLSAIVFAVWPFFLSVVCDSRCGLDALNVL